MASTSTAPANADAYELRVVRFTLDPNQEQIHALKSHVGATRFAYNRLLAEAQRVKETRAKEADAGVPEDERTPTMGLTPFSLSKVFNANKDQWCVNEAGEPWWSENSTYAYESAAKMLGSAFDNFFKSLKGTRRGRRVGYPKFKSRRDALGVTFRGKGVRFDAASTRRDPRRSTNRITLPRIGSVRVHEDVKASVPFVSDDATTIQRATVKLRRGRWVVVVLFRVAPATQEVRPPQGGRVALDLGAMGDGSNIIIGVDDTGDIVYRLTYPESLSQLYERKRRLQTLGRNKIGGQRGVAQSNRYKKHVAKIAKIDHTMANIRENLLHEATDHLTRRFSAIVIEGLEPAGMVVKGGKRKAHMNRLVLMSAFATVRQQLEYKSKRTGAVLLVAPRHEVTNRACASCGGGCAKPRRLHSEQIFECDTCHVEVHRSVNTARNLFAWADGSVAHEAKGAG